MNADDEWIVNWFWILLSLKQFEKIQLVFTNHELNEEKAEIDKWDMNLDDLMNYKYIHDSWIQSILIMIKTDQWQHKEITLIECKIWNDWLFYWNNLIVSNFKFLWFKILEFVHDVIITEHSDHAKIYEIVQQVYYWFMMHDFVRKYVWFCSTCAWEKS